MNRIRVDAECLLLTQSTISPAEREARKKYVLLADPAGHPQLLIVSVLTPTFDLLQARRQHDQGPSGRRAAPAHQRALFGNVSARVCVCGPTVLLLAVLAGSCDYHVWQPLLVVSERGHCFFPSIRMFLLIQGRRQLGDAAVGCRVRRPVA